MVLKKTRYVLATLLSLSSFTKKSTINPTVKIWVKWSRLKHPSKSFNYFQSSVWLLHALDIWGQCLLFLPSYLLNLLLVLHKTCIVGQLFLLNLFYALCPSIKAAPNYIYSSEFLYDILYRPQQRYICFFQSYCPPIFVQRSKLACNLQCQRKNKTIPSVIFLDSLTISIFHDMQQKLSLLPLLKRNSLHFLCSLLISSLNYPLSFSIVCYLSKTDTATNSILFTPILWLDIYKA